MRLPKSLYLSFWGLVIYFFGLSLLFLISESDVPEFNLFLGIGLVLVSLLLFYWANQTGYWDYYNYKDTESGKPYLIGIVIILPIIMFLLNIFVFNNK